MTKDREDRSLQIATRGGRHGTMTAIMVGGKPDRKIGGERGSMTAIKVGGRIPGRDRGDPAPT